MDDRQWTVQSMAKVTADIVLSKEDVTEGWYGWEGQGDGDRGQDEDEYMGEWSMVSMGWPERPLKFSVLYTFEMWILAQWNATDAHSDHSNQPINFEATEYCAVSGQSEEYGPNNNLAWINVRIADMTNRPIEIVTWLQMNLTGWKRKAGVPAWPCYPGTFRLHERWLSCLCARFHAPNKRLLAVSDADIRTDSRVASRNDRSQDFDSKMSRAFDHPYWGPYCQAAIAYYQWRWEWFSAIAILLLPNCYCSRIFPISIFPFPIFPHSIFLPDIYSDNSHFRYSLLPIPILPIDIFPMKIWYYLLPMTISYYLLPMAIRYYLFTIDITYFSMYL